MDALYSFFFGAGIATFFYAKIGRRTGYDNMQSNWVVVGIVFVVAFLVFYTIFKFFLSSSQGGVVNP